MKPRTGRNDPCPCGSGRKYKKCCLPEDRKKAAPHATEVPSATATEEASRAPQTSQEITVTAEAQKVGEIGFLSRFSLERVDELEPPVTLVDPDKLYATPEAARRRGETQIGGLVREAPVAAQEEVREFLIGLGYVPLHKMKKGCGDFEAELALADEGHHPTCGLCGNMLGLTRTMCCDEWICDDEANYVIFSYARNSCYRNHQRHTLCGAHYAEEHEGDWQQCDECREQALKTEMYVWNGTNEYNFQTLEDPPDFEPTHCAECGCRIHLGQEGFSISGDRYECQDCGSLPDLE